MEFSLYILRLTARKAMQSQIKTSEFQQAIEAVENLSLDDQEVLLSIL